jgi:hypothetical protein
MRYTIALSLLLSISGYTKARNAAPNLEGAYQWDKVNISLDEIDTKKFYKIDLISTKATAPWGFSSVTNTQNRALRKLKIAAALLGGNTVNLKFNVIDARNGVRPVSRVQMVGAVYCSRLVDTLKFKQLIQEDKEFTLVSKIGMRNNDANIHTFDTNNETVLVDSYSFENGFIFPELSIVKKRGDKLKMLPTNKNHDRMRVVSISESHILVSYKDRSSIYNLLLARK